VNLIWLGVTASGVSSCEIGPTEQAPERGNSLLAASQQAALASDEGDQGS
jgi:hypothetical protein